ncbi:hypothetical protein ACEWY4_027680 [Coilia grayii]|uniref:Ig-like domain-containing protein n=1 Tax=Coilia grayii TaxID=363190 RepID=A0ABD1IP16_9TELE
MFRVKIVLVNDVCVCVCVCVSLSLSHSRMARFTMFPLLVFSTLLAATGAGVVGPDAAVVGVVGQDLLLPCTVRPVASAVDDEVKWKIGTDIVHHYHRHQDLTGQQLPDYRGRTSLSRQELLKGNVSLMLKSLKLSDAKTYRCYVAAETWAHEAPVIVTVETRGSDPSITTESLGSGRVRLQCQSEGWSSEPQVHWLNSRGQPLPAEPTVFQRLPEGLRVVRNITVKEDDGRNFTCVVSSEAQSRKHQVEVLRDQCGDIRHRYWTTPPLLLLIAVMAGLAFTASGGVEEVRWLEGEEPICTYSDGRLQVSRGFEGRVTLDTHSLQTGGLSLTLRMTRAARKHCRGIATGGPGEACRRPEGLPLGGLERPAGGLQLESL